MAKSRAKSYTFTHSMDLYKRAVKVIPSGIYGHQNPTILVPTRYPYYIDRAEGAYFWDVDGNKYLDFMMGYGPIILGYKDPVVEEAVSAQRAKGAVCASMPPAVMVELGELMVDTVKGADWVSFAKNGGDATTYCVRIAREQTGRKKILATKGGYHGVAPWCGQGHGGIIEEDREHVHLFPFNDIAAIKALVEQYKGQIAGVIMTPYHHPAFADSVMPLPGFWQEVRQLCDKEGIVLIVDDVRAGFRLSLHGSHDYFGFTPDLVAFSKAIANSYPLSAVTGRAALRQAAARIFVTGSFWNNADAYAAAVATITELKNRDTLATMNKMGALLSQGITSAAADLGLQVKITGPAAIPYMSFANETDFKRMQLFCAEASARGVFYHPHHNWFLSGAHTEADIAFAVDVAKESLKVVKETFGG